jgi:hypothetical protein
MTTDGPTFRDTRTVPLVSALVDSGLVLPDRRAEAVAVVDRVLGAQAPTPAPLRRRFAELAGYVGGALVVSAAAVFFTSRWDDLGEWRQTGLLAGIAVVLAVAGLAVVASARPDRLRAGGDPVRRRLAGVLLTAAAASAAGAVGILVEQWVGDDATTSALLGSLTLGALSLAGYLVAPTVVGQLGVAVGAESAVLFGLDGLGDVPTVVTGLCVLALGVVWLVATERGLWREVASARVLGCGLALVGAEIPVFDSAPQRMVGYLLLGLVAVAAFGVYVARPAWPYLAAGVIAVTLVVPEALLDWTDNAMGPAGAMLVTGMALLGGSLLGLRLRRTS